MLKHFFFVHVRKCVIIFKKIKNKKRLCNTSIIGCLNFTYTHEVVYLTSRGHPIDQEAIFIIGYVRSCYTCLAFAELPRCVTYQQVGGDTGFFSLAKEPALVSPKALM